MGFALVGFGFQDTDPTVPAVVGVVVIVNAAVVHGPFGAFRLIGRRVHRWIDLVVMAFLVFAALQPWFAVSSLGRLVLLAIVVPLAFLWWYTDWHERPERARRRADRAVPRSDDLGRAAGRKAADVYKAGKRLLDKHD